MGGRVCKDSYIAAGGRATNAGYWHISEVPPPELDGRLGFETGL